jgi:sec-independent protein translocase protein TatA
MLGNLTGWHFLIVLAIVLLLFGATKLPALAKSVGQSMKVFRNEIRTDDKPADDPAVKAGDGSTGVPAPADKASDKK